jgi:hypothetical protein
MNGVDIRAAAMCAPTRAVILVSAGISVLAGCAEERKAHAPTEQEIHARDFETASGVRGRHLYACNDGEHLYIDFKDEGLSIELRRQEQESAQTLSAPAQGLQYVGDNASVTITGNEVKIMEGQDRVRVCRKR